MCQHVRQVPAPAHPHRHPGGRGAIGCRSRVSPTLLRFDPRDGRGLQGPGRSLRPSIQSGRLIRLRFNYPCPSGAAACGLGGQSAATPLAGIPFERTRNECAGGRGERYERRRILRVDGWGGVVAADCGDGGDAGWWWLLVGGVGWGDFCFRGRPVPWVDGWGARWSRPIVGMACRRRMGRWLLVGGVGWGVFCFRGRPVPWVDGWGAVVAADCGGWRADAGWVGGYWLVASDGGIFAFRGRPVPWVDGWGAVVCAVVVGMACRRRMGGGYWSVASDGGVFAYGDARFYGSTGGVRLSQAD